MKRRQLFYVCSLIIFLFARMGLADKKPSTFKVPSLKNIDRVELLNIKTEKGSVITAIIATKLLEGKDAVKVVELWRKQKISPYTSSACHHPPYAIKFYSGNKVIVYASICWDCHDISFIIPESQQWSEFEVDTPDAQDLRKVFEQAFPGRKEG